MNEINEMKSLTLNGKTYDSFRDQTAREAAKEFLVTVTKTGDEKYSADKTFEQIKGACEAGRRVCCKYSNRLFALTIAVPAAYHFGGINNAGMYTQIAIGSTDVVTVNTYDLAGTVNAVKTVNGTAPGADGNVTVDVPAPVKGVDYYTPEDKAEFDAVIAEELAKRGQLKPEFANTIEDCTDPTKVYVLPDGYLYAYVTTEVTEEVVTYTNRLPLSVEADGSPYNGGQGWKTNTRLSSSGNESTSSATGLEVTGFIPFKKGDVIRFSGITMNANSEKHDKCYFNQYDADKNVLKTWIVSAFNSAISSGHVLVDDLGNILQINTGTLGDENSSASYPIYSNAAYFRISADEINANSIITINEEIAPTTITHKQYSWVNTGHAFVPADYEGRIVAVEAAAGANRESVESHEARISILEQGSAGTNPGSAGGVPAYVTAEADDVINRVIAAQGNRTFTFAAITDMHCGNGSYTDGLVHACQAMKYIDSRIKLDAVAVLGDYTDGHADDGAGDYANAIADFQAINAELNSLRFAPNLRIHGNHDFCGTHFPALHRYITAYSDDVTWGSKPGGYFYRDFDDFKLRVICLNTAEENGDGLSCSTDQYHWFAGALDLSGKEDSAQWQTLLLSHHPLDWFPETGKGYVFWRILNAYLTGTSWSNADGTISCNFAGKNGAKLVGNIHGHIHNLMTRKIAAGQPNQTENTIEVVRIATPEACYGRPNSYNGDWTYNPFGEEVSYPKTKGTAKDTSFCIYCIDLDTHTIKAICCGAGYDREISY